MPAWARTLIVAAIVLTVGGGFAYWWLFQESSLPGEGRFVIDLAEVRRLASAVPGDKPLAIRVERLGRFPMRGVAVVAGDNWRNVDFPVLAYQLVYTGGKALIDVGMTAQQARDMGAATFSEAAFARLEKALAEAIFVVVTHEHADHMGTLAAAKNLPELMPKLRLTARQVDPGAGVYLVQLPQEALAGYQPLSGEPYVAVAPGVVAIAAPGHTPGSTIFYVQRADGAEYLFLGDVAWHLRNVEAMRQRPRIVTDVMISENRSAVMRQLVELNRLLQDEPGVHQVPGHDGKRIDALLAAGLLAEGFR